MELANAIEQLLGQKIENLRDSIRLRDDGKGAYIHTWDAETIGRDKPTQEELEATWLEYETTQKPKEKRIKALKKLDPLVCQIQRYELLELDSSIAKAKLNAAMIEVNDQYPEV